MKVLYLFSGTRINKIKKMMSGKLPDTQLYGMNHLVDFGIDAETKEIPFNFLNFRIKHLLSFFLIKDQQIIFGSSILYMMLLQKIFRKNTKFVLLNISLNRTLNKYKNNKFKLRFIKYLLKEINHIICLSNYQRRQLIDKFNIPKEKVVFIPLGVDIDFYKPNFDHRDQCILSVGRDNGRDYQTVVNIAKKMPTEEFVIICSQRNLLGIINIPQNVKIIYDLPKNDLKLKYQQAKLLLLLTHTDNYSDGADCSGQTVLLDAGASGLPVVATSKEYIKDYAKDGQDLILVEPNNPLAVVTAINNLKNNELALTMAKHARQNIERNFSTKKMAENLSIIFKKI